MTQTNLLSVSEDFTYGQSVKGLVERILFQLGDAQLGDAGSEFDEQWVKARLLDVFKWFQGRNPSLFAAEKTVTLEPGVRHQRPEGCDNLIEVTEVVTPKGDVPVCEADYKDLQSARRLSKDMPHCMDDFCIYHYAKNKNNKGEFLFSPELKEPLEVRVTCSDTQSYFEDCEKEIDCEFVKYFNAVIEFVVWQGMSMDAENGIIAQLSDQHRVAFFDLAPTRPASTRDDSDRQT